MSSFRLETQNYSSNGYTNEPLDMSKNLTRLMLEFDLQYDTDAAVARYKDGYGSGLIDFIQIRDGGLIPFKVYGFDMWILEQLIYKRPHGLTQLITTASQSDQVIEDKFNLTLDMPNSVFANPILEIDWGVPTNLGASGDYTVDSASVNGTYELTDLPVFHSKLVPNLKSGQTGNCKMNIDAEGRLAYILIICRANAADYALRSALTTVEVKIEDSYNVYDADNLLTEYSRMSGQAESTGVYLIHFNHKPLIGTASKIIMNMDATSTDFNVYFAYVDPNYVGDYSQPDVIGGSRVEATSGPLARHPIYRDPRLSIGSVRPVQPGSGAYRRSTIPLPNLDDFRRNINPGWETGDTGPGGVRLRRF